MSAPPERVVDVPPGTDAPPRGGFSAGSALLTPAPELSVVIAVYNERESLEELARQIVAAMDVLGMTWEAIFVDDGSNDGSRELEVQICQQDGRFRAAQLRRNFGKAAALSVGFHHARGRYVAQMDADLQDDPFEIAKLLAPILDGSHDLVTGWKWPRLDPPSKLIPSRIYNTVSRMVTGLSLHDMNCGLKAYRREVLDEITVYGDMHRYIPVLAVGVGFRVTEVKVTHRPRVHGHSKYAAGRFARGFLDLLTVLFLTRYERRPLHLIGGLGLTMGITGFGLLLYLTSLWMLGYPIGHRPLLFLGMLLMLVASQFITFGLLAEMMTYQNHRLRNEYPVHALVGFDAAASGTHPAPR
jgi:glycosyltransferase involved in cell wall biosynthesis